MSVNVTESSTFTTTSDTADNQIVASTVTRPRLVAFYADTTNLATTATAVFRIKTKIDGTNYRAVPTANGTVDHTWTRATDAKGVCLILFGVDVAVQVTIQLATGEAVSLPYRLVEVMLD